MRRKWVMTVVLTMVACLLVFGAYNNIGNASGIFVKGIEQNKVYTLKQTGVSNKNLSNTLAGDRTENIFTQAANTLNVESKENALKALEFYLNVSPKTSKYSKMIEYKVIKSYEYDSFKWVTSSSEVSAEEAFELYAVVYNKASKRIEGVTFISKLNYENEKTNNPQQDEDIAERFIVKNNINGIKNPKLIYVDSQKYSFINIYYKDAYNSEKKVRIVINPDTDKVVGFYINALSDPSLDSGIF